MKTKPKSISKDRIQFFVRSEDNPDVFFRIAMVLSRKRYQIIHFKLDQNLKGKDRKMVFLVQGSPSSFPQVMKQILKLVNVLQVMSIPIPINKETEKGEIVESEYKDVGGQTL
jgi:acetolactate synthase small subunit